MILNILKLRYGLLLILSFLVSCETNYNYFKYELEYLSLSGPLTGDAVTNLEDYPLKLKGNVKKIEISSYEKERIGLFKSVKGLLSQHKRIYHFDNDGNKTITELLDTNSELLVRCNPKSNKDNKGYITCFCNENNKIKKRKYDSNFNVLEDLTQYRDGEIFHRILYRYDNNGNTIEFTRGDEFYPQYFWMFEYDEKGKLIKKEIREYNSNDDYEVISVHVFEYSKYRNIIYELRYDVYPVELRQIRKYKLNKYGYIKKTESKSPKNKLFKTLKKFQYKYDETGNWIKMITNNNIHIRKIEYY